MKALAVQQPWATLLCLGVKDVENRTWATKHRGKLLIVASQKKVTKNFMNSLPDEMYWELENQMKLQNVPDNLQALQTSAVIGYVEVVDCVEDYDSPWADPDAIKWIVKSAHLFTKPQLIGYKAKLNVFDIPEINEDNLPESIELEQNCPEVEDGMFYLPTKDETIDSFAESIKENNGIFLDIDRSWCFDQAFPKKRNKPVLDGIEIMCFVGDTKYMNTSLNEISIVQDTDEDGKKLYNEYSITGKRTPKEHYHFDIGKVLEIQKIETEE